MNELRDPDPWLKCLKKLQGASSCPQQVSPTIISPLQWGFNSKVSHVLANCFTYCWESSKKGQRAWISLYTKRNPNHSVNPLSLRTICPTLLIHRQNRQRQVMLAALSQAKQDISAGKQLSSREGRRCLCLVRLHQVNCTRSSFMNLRPLNTQDPHSPLPSGSNCS